MTRLEFLAHIKLTQALIETGNVAKLNEVLNDLISTEARAQEKETKQENKQE